MDKQQAQAIIKNTFEKPFDKVRFTNFIKNLLNSIDGSKAFHAHGYVKEGFSGIIKTYERIGTYNSTDDKKIDIIIVYLQKGFSLDHARVTQRNFAGRYLVDRGEKDAGLFAFVSPDETDWRFSLVKMDYKFEMTKTGRMKVKEEFTPARRWSFLVGANEKSHTAQSQMVKILADDEHNSTLAELEQAFDIETVTKEFFEKYRELFLRTKEELDRVVKKDPKIKADFEAKGVDTVNFAKKLLGQIIFLYFLQKKGWFGVGRDDDWGTGSKHFLRELFEKKHADYNNFFNDILEPLFYDALRNDRSHDDGYYSRFNCKIPFLNGGLFDPIGNYDWVHTDIIIPDKLFSNNVKTKEGDIGTGILDVFDRYNFTVKEDEPLEKEVAIDPELLGKSYEKFNAIRPDNFDEFKKALKSGKKGEENKFNKKFGVYYTPREIVHYMCQQSLINYLNSELNSESSSYQKLGDSQLDMFGNKAKKGQL
ncbi:MAG: class I SAM-dependent DNA methyltransferase, partial [Deltaproteobacteria bacterium]|nr:class I SAM-dependent DNA methyltransferase [Deltaproteobacteria bacterium]